MATGELPSYQLQSLIDGVIEGSWTSQVTDGPDSKPSVTCARALGPEVYVGCSNGELLRFSIQGDDANTPGSYTLLSRQSMPNNKPIVDVVLAPSISRLFVLSDRQLFFFTLPVLDMIPANVIKPLRNVVTFAVDEQHVRRPLARPDVQGDAVDFVIIKRTSIALFTLKDKLMFLKDIPLPSGATMAKRTGQHLCIADHDNYNMIDLNAGLLFPLLPLSQAPDAEPAKPSITVITDNEFLILTWNGATTMGLFITGEGDPVRGTLEWPAHPLSVTCIFPHVMALMPDGNVVIHNVDTQLIVQEIPATSFASPPTSLVDCLSGFSVPSTQRTQKLRPKSIKLLRSRGDAQVTRPEAQKEAPPVAEDEEAPEHLEL